MLPKTEASIFTLPNNSHTSSPVSKTQHPKTSQRIQRQTHTSRRAHPHNSTFQPYQLPPVDDRTVQQPHNPLTSLTNHHLQPTPSTSRTLRPPRPTMGLVYNTYLNSDKIFGCKNCKTHLASHDAIISRVSPLFLVVFLLFSQTPTYHPPSYST